MNEWILKCSLCNVLVYKCYCHDAISYTAEQNLEKAAAHLLVSATGRGISVRGWQGSTLIPTCRKPGTRSRHQNFLLCRCRAAGSELTRAEYPWSFSFSSWPFGGWKQWLESPHWNVRPTAGLWLIICCLCCLGQRGGGSLRSQTLIFRLRGGYRSRTGLIWDQ
jgi:hypothetical protein